jgi:acyl-CoA thioesterase FadM
MTASLTLHYRRPTPLFTRLVFEARIREVDGRKIYVTGELRDDEQTFVDAEGLFVLPSNATSDELRGIVRAGRVAAEQDPS